jgi:hypothetical protein
MALRKVLSFQMRKGLLKQMGFYRDQLEFSIKVRALFDSFDDDGSGTNQISRESRARCWQAGPMTESQRR